MNVIEIQNQALYLVTLYKRRHIWNDPKTDIRESSVRMLQTGFDFLKNSPTMSEERKASLKAALMILKNEIDELDKLRS